MGQEVANDVQQAWAAFVDRLKYLEKCVEAAVRSGEVEASLTEQLLRLSKAVPPQTGADKNHTLFVEVWKQAFDLWNACVELHNQRNGAIDENNIKLRQAACNLLLATGVDDVRCVHMPFVKRLQLFVKTGTLWMAFGKFELAEVCFSKATEFATKLEEELSKPSDGDDPESTSIPSSLLLELWINRAQTAWAIGQKPLASNLLSRACNECSKSKSLDKLGTIVEKYLNFSKDLMRHGAKEATAEAITYLEKAFELCSQASGKEAQVKAEAQAVVRYLAATHLKNQSFQSAWRVLSSPLATSCKAVGNHFSQHYIAVQALGGMRRFEQAETELQALVSHPKADPQTCLQALIIFVTHGRVAAAKAAFFQLHSRFSTHAMLPVYFADMLLREKQEQAVATALEVLTTDSIASLVASSDVSNNGNCKPQRCCHALLWQCGVDLFNSKTYDLASSVLEASMLYLRPYDTENKAKTLRVLCLCSLGTSQLETAVDYLNMAEKINPDNTVCAFLKFKLFLMQKDQDAAMKQLDKILACSDFEPAFLMLATHETVIAKAGVSIAVAALALLLQYYTANNQRERQVVLIRNITKQLAQAPEINYTELSGYFELARKRLQTDGYDAFFGDGKNGQQECLWLAEEAWNHGIDAGVKGNGTECVILLTSAADFQAALPASLETLSRERLSLILACSRLLELHTPDDGPSDLRMVLTLLDRCAKVQEKVARHMDTQQPDKSEVYYNLLLFDATLRLRDTKGLENILNACKSVPGFGADSFIKMAVTACRQPHVNMHIAVAAFRISLSMLCNEPAPDYRLICTIYRRLIGLSDACARDSTDAHQLYREVCELLNALKQQDCPKEEGQWLVSTCWNRAALHAKFGRLSEAETWMKLALQLLKNFPAMEVHKPAMVDALADLLKQTAPMV